MEHAAAACSAAKEKGKEKENENSMDKGKRNLSVLQALSATMQALPNELEDRSVHMAHLQETMRVLMHLRRHGA
jgi:hypothetical protein